MYKKVYKAQTRNKTFLLKNNNLSAPRFVQILTYSNGSLLIKPRTASKMFRSILLLLLMNVLGQIKNYGRTELYTCIPQKTCVHYLSLDLYLKCDQTKGQPSWKAQRKGKGKEECERENGTSLPTIFLTKPIRSIINT